VIDGLGGVHIADNAILGFGTGVVATFSSSLQPESKVDMAPINNQPDALQDASSHNGW
jgi:hypothetical protein